MSSLESVRMGVRLSVKTMTATTVIDYIVQRLVNEGITDCFGVPDDYAFPVCDAVDRNPNIKWIGCSNELNASYAADGYASVRGTAVLSTTYAVGGLSRRDQVAAHSRWPACSYPTNRREPRDRRARGRHQFWHRRSQRRRHGHRSCQCRSDLHLGSTGAAYSSAHSHGSYPSGCENCRRADVHKLWARHQRNHKVSEDGSCLYPSQERA